MSRQLVLGKTGVGSPIQWQGVPNWHAYITGASGFGKTYELRSMAAQVPGFGGRAIIFDYTGDFVTKYTQQNWPPAGTAVINIRSGEISLNPFIAETMGETDEEIAERVVSIINQGIRLGSSQWASDRRIDKIINRSEAIVASQFQALPGDVSNVFHLKEHQTRIRNAAVSNYLIYWLRNDMDSQQNLRSFKMSSCQRDPSPNILNENYFDCEYRNFINYGFEHVYLLQKWRNEQASEEGTLSNSLPQRGTTTWEIPLSFIDLAWCEAFQNGELRLAEMAIEFHSILSNSKDHGSNKSLKEACDSLISLAKRIEALGEKTDSESCKRYVASCMMLCEFEEAYRFALIAKIAKKVSENKIHWNKADLENRTAIMNLFWGRYPSQLLTAFRYGLNVDGHEPFFGKIDSHRNLLNYDFEIACLYFSRTFSNGKSLPPSHSIYIFRKIS